ncbi:uncharacterized protein PGRI_021980 [Penicillium griseofulvum]|uniref:Uncharacterized protein n=1 Tax=Penicillium patulum TaxID=5078 RepID=A0A135LH98_PENPA|nr:uncharacterized protein PGRI_021980 [Penicillium griseofulvum]KXG48328.1 hypothetical protein PGRI_021980 [Penicillium griseofulvum]
MPPVTNGQFSFNVDTFYVAASGGQIHRRAAPAEIKALYDTSITDKSTPDHPGHWYEAQLLHYGLPPSKVKATAKMRLLKAVQDGGLSVPKETQATTKVTTTKTVTTKTITVSKTVASKSTESKTTVSKAAAKPTAVKPATIKAATSKPALPKKETAPRTVAPKTTAPKATAAKSAAVKAATTKATPKAAAKPAAIKAAVKPADVKIAAAKSATPKAAPKKATAAKAAAPKATTAKSATPQTIAAKRKRASNDDETPNKPQAAKRRVYAKKTQDSTNVPTDSHPETSRLSEQPEYQDAPPSYEFACRMDGEHPYNALGDLMDIDDVSEDPGHSSESEAYPSSPPRTLKNPLGLLNGTYKIWGKYEFGAFKGVLWMPERPMKPSFDRFVFKWRGRETGEGEMSFGDDQEGWIEFLGDGDIVGMINCCGDLHFRGQRIDGYVQTASELRDEWDGYNEEEYGRENRARWGGWGW